MIPKIARIVRPIHGEDEIEQILDLVAPARIVLIGEASHGTHEFYDLRASFTRKSIGGRGFAAVRSRATGPTRCAVYRPES